MSVKHLGTRFDIHTGGVDHIPVHHPNEIAQSEAALGVHPWVPYWLHGGWLMFGDSKLSKSTGGSVLNLDALLETGVAPLSYRYFLLGGHYRQQLAFSEDAIRGAQTSLDPVQLKEWTPNSAGPLSHGAGERWSSARASRGARRRSQRPRHSRHLGAVRSGGVGGREMGLLVEFDGSQD
jgi:cysteinyl-tRNA synthetase